MGANNSHPANYETAAYAILSVETFLTTVAVLSRVVSRKLMKGKLLTDDVITYIAYVSNLALLVSAFFLTKYGGLNEKTAEIIANDEPVLFEKSYNAFAYFYVFAMTLIKLSLLFLYRRTFQMFNDLFRYAWYFILVFIFLWFGTCVILLELDVHQMPKGGFSRLGISITGILNAFSDIMILCLPAFMVAKMTLETKQKLGVIAIFTLGALASLVSVVRGTIFLVNRGHALNQAYSNYLNIVLTATEASAGLICTCLPLIKPIIVRIVRWVQVKCGMEVQNEGSSTLSRPPTIGEMTDRRRTMLTADAYHVQLLTASQNIQVPPDVEDRDRDREKNPWRLSQEEQDVQKPGPSHQPQ